VLKLRTLVLLFAVTSASQAEWKILSAESEPGRGGIEHRHVDVEDAGSGQRVTVDLALFPGKSTALRIIDNPDAQSLSAIMKREKCVISIRSSSRSACELTTARLSHPYGGHV
jgi:hypothetical protein